MYELDLRVFPLRVVLLDNHLNRPQLLLIAEVLQQA